MEAIRERDGIETSGDCVSKVDFSGDDLTPESHSKREHRSKHDRCRPPTAQPSTLSFTDLIDPNKADDTWENVINQQQSTEHRSPRKTRLLARRGNTGHALPPPPIEPVAPTKLPSPRQSRRTSANAAVMRPSEGITTWSTHNSPQLAVPPRRGSASRRMSHGTSITGTAQIAAGATRLEGSRRTAPSGSRQSLRSRQSTRRASMSNSAEANFETHPPRRASMHGALPVPSSPVKRYPLPLNSKRTTESPKSRSKPPSRPPLVESTFESKPPSRKTDKTPISPVRTKSEDEEDPTIVNKFSSSQTLFMSPIKRAKSRNQLLSSSTSPTKSVQSLSSKDTLATVGLAVEDYDSSPIRNRPLKTDIARCMSPNAIRASPRLSKKNSAGRNKVKESDKSASLLVTGLNKMNHHSSTRTDVPAFDPKTSRGVVHW